MSAMTFGATGTAIGHLRPEIEQLFREHSQMLYCTAYTRYARCNRTMAREDIP